MSIIYARSFHKDAVKNIWGVEVEGQDINVYTLDAISSAGGLGYTSLSNSMAKKLKKDQVLVLEKYIKPTVEYPNGRLIIIAGDKLLYMGELPYINKGENKRGFPFIRQTSLSSPNCFWGSSIIERCIPVQRAFNAVKNRKHEYLNRLTMGVLAVEDGSMDIENDSSHFLWGAGISPGLSCNISKRLTAVAHVGVLSYMDCEDVLQNTTVSLDCSDISFSLYYNF
jgi:hypothetical protein